MTKGEMCPYKTTLCQEVEGCRNCQIYLDWQVRERDNTREELVEQLRECDRMAACLDNIQVFCGQWIKDGIDGAEVARSFGNTARAQAFENRTAALRGIFKIMERYGIADSK